MSDPVRAALEHLLTVVKPKYTDPEEIVVAICAARAALAQSPPPAEREVPTGESPATGLLPMIVSETGAAGEPELERIICSAISGGADYVNGMPRELWLEKVKVDIAGRKSTFAKYIQASFEVDQASPPAPPAEGEVAELVKELSGLADYFSDEEPTDEELLRLAADALGYINRPPWDMEATPMSADDVLTIARAAIAADRARWGHPAAPPPAEGVAAELVAENRKLRSAGCNLAEAAIRVAQEYDGVHRLMLTVSEWAKTVADEGGRGEAVAHALPLPTITTEKTYG